MKGHYAEVTERNLTKLLHMFGSESDLKIDVNNFGAPSPKTIYWTDSTDSRTI